MSLPGDCSTQRIWDQTTILRWCKTYPRTNSDPFRLSRLGQLERKPDVRHNIQYSTVCSKREAGYLSKCSIEFWLRHHTGGWDPQDTPGYIQFQGRIPHRLPLRRRHHRSLVVVCVTISEKRARMTKRNIQHSVPGGTSSVCPS